ncbi:MAG: dihydrofolate reductase family protein [Coriobacteriales bacterium]|nr:dihydrofolate reductase family protein [Coriobacteriales bacterium]
MNRPVTTLFMLMSVDGKISTGPTDDFDFDKDLPNVPGVRDGLHQYYQIEQTTDLWSLNTGRVMAKIGANVLASPKMTPVSFAILDNTHLTKAGVRWLCAKAKQLVLITSNARHPALSVDAHNLSVLYQEKPSLLTALGRLHTEFGCERLTIQSGGTLNAAFLHKKLIDFVDVVLAPVLVGGADTPTLVDGAPLANASELKGLGILELVDCTTLQNSYLRLRYRVMS